MELLERHCNHYDITRYIGQVLEAARTSERPASSRATPAKAAVGLSADQVAQLLDSYVSGASTYELAERFSIRRDMVATYVQRAGLAVRPGPHPALNDAAQSRAAALYIEGASLRSIATRFGVSDNTVLKALRAQDVPSRPRRGGVEHRT